MIEINRKLISELFDKALLNPRFRQNKIGFVSPARRYEAKEQLYVPPSVW